MAARTTQQKKERFLERYAEIGTITHAALASGITRRTHYNWLAEDAEYAEAFHAAEVAVADMLEQEAIRRATHGVVKGVYHQGQLVAEERQYSDTLLIFLLKGHKPEKFKDRHQIESEVTVHDGDSVDREIARLAAELAGRAEGRTPGGTPVAQHSST